MPKENSKKTVKPGIIGKTNEIAIKNFNLVKKAPFSSEKPRKTFTKPSKTRRNKDNLKMLSGPWLENPSSCITGKFFLL